MTDKLPAMVLCLFFVTTSLGEDREPIILNGHQTEVTSLVFGPEGDRIYSTALKEDHIWSLKTGKSMGPIEGVRGHCIEFSPDGKQFVLSGFKTTSLYDAANQKRLWTIQVGVPRYSPPFLHDLVFSPDGNILATSGSSTRPGGRHGYKAGIITIIDPRTGKELRAFTPTSTVASQIAMSPDSQFLAAGTEGAGTEIPETGELLVWKIETGELVHQLKHVKEIKPGKNRCSVSGVAFHPKGKEIAIASSDGTVRVWDLKTETICLTLQGHENEVLRVAYNPDGSRLASAGKDRSVRIWDANNGSSLKSLPINCPKINALVFSPNGRHLAAGGGNFLKSGLIKVWTLSED